MLRKGSQLFSSTFKINEYIFFPIPCSNQSFLFYYDVTVVVQSLSCVRLFATPWTAPPQASLRLPHARLPCPSPIPGACSNSCPSSQWCHPTISSSVTSFSSCPQYFPASGSFPVSRLFASGSQSIGASTSASVLPSGYSWLIFLTGLISFLSEEVSSGLKVSILWCSAFFMVQLSHFYMTTGKTIALTRRTFVSKAMSLLFNTLSRFIIAFLPRSVF